MPAAQPPCAKLAHHSLGRVPHTCKETVCAHVAAAQASTACRPEPACHVRRCSTTDVCAGGGRQWRLGLMCYLQCPRWCSSLLAPAGNTHHAQPDRRTLIVTAFPDQHTAVQSASTSPWKSSPECALRSTCLAHTPTAPLGPFTTRQCPECSRCPLSMLRALSLSHHCPSSSCGRLLRHHCPVARGVAGLTGGLKAGL